jgi:excinuclease UvrABC helicase subunit UvrB
MSIVKDIRYILPDRIEAPSQELEAVPGDQDPEALIAHLENEMKLAASGLRFEDAAIIRDRLVEVKKQLLKRGRKKV